MKAALLLLSGSCAGAVAPSETMPVPSDNAVVVNTAELQKAVDTLDVRQGIQEERLQALTDTVGELHGKEAVDKILAEKKEAILKSAKEQQPATETPTPPPPPAEPTVAPQ